MSQIFKILFQTGDIDIFVLSGVFFSRYAQLKSFSFDEKHISGEIWDTLYDLKQIRSTIQQKLFQYFQLFHYLVENAAKY